jgi:hypothetical protein
MFLGAHRDGRPCVRVCPRSRHVVHTGGGSGGGEGEIGRPDRGRRSKSFKTRSRYARPWDRYPPAPCGYRARHDVPGPSRRRVVRRAPAVKINVAVRTARPPAIIAVCPRASNGSSSRYPTARMRFNTRSTSGGVNFYFSTTSRSTTSRKTTRNTLQAA